MTAVDDAADPPDEVVELTGLEGGVWHIHTEHSMHVIDLDVGTVERRAGPRARKLADQVRPLREIELCQVGEYGSWTMWSTDQHFDFYRYSATLVQRIVRATNKYDNSADPDEVHTNQDAAVDQARKSWGDQDVEELYRRLGPWVAINAVAEFLELDSAEIKAKVEHGELIGIEFSDHELYFPKWQFIDGGVVPGIDRILTVLKDAFHAAESRAAWFLEPIDDGGPTKIDLLRGGHEEKVLAEAKMDVAWLLRP